MCILKVYIHYRTSLLASPDAGVSGLEEASRLYSGEDEVESASAFVARNADEAAL